MGREPGKRHETSILYTEAGCAILRTKDSLMVETRIKPYAEQEAEREKHEAQRRAFRRNQVFGLVILAAAICAWWLFHTNPKWIAPPGWWRW